MLFIVGLNCNYSITVVHFIVNGGSFKIPEPTIRGGGDFWVYYPFET